METRRNRNIFQPNLKESNDGPDYKPETDKTLLELERAFQENVHKAQGDCEEDSRQDKTATGVRGSSVATTRGMAVHRLRSTPLGMRRAIDIFLPSLVEVNEVECPSLQDDMTNRKQLPPSQAQLMQAAAPCVVMRNGRELTALSDFELMQDGQQGSMHMDEARRTIERARRINMSFNRALLERDLPSPGGSLTNNTFRGFVGGMRRSQEKRR